MPTKAEIITSTTIAEDPPVLSRWLTFAMAGATGIAVANIYYNQPMLGIMQAEFPGQLAGLVPTVTQLGYALGIFLLVPLGDLVERKKLIILQFGLLFLALAGVALAPNASVLLLTSLLVGVGATVAQQIIPLAAHLSDPNKRGATVGLVMSGLLCGILFSRTLAGFVSTHSGWREMFALAVPMALAACAVMAWKLPRSHPEPTMGYPALLGSILGLWREFPELRVATLTQSSLFAAFSVFWTILVFQLESPAFNLGPDAAGLFGIIGAIGILAAPFAGKLADKRGPHMIVLFGTSLTLVSWVIFGFWISIPGLIVGVILLDLALQSAMIPNQHIIYALRPSARARVNTIFIGSMFLGGSLGSALALQIWTAFGWTGVCLLGGGFCAIATALQLVRWSARRSR
ncbi:MAG: MFS transporter [Rhodospirillaceae bacterium]|uniref:MFS transporter n=1 Tax=Hwanghaeella sp. 1Z406 TaxID=3402811 RepID=UPI000C545897|nr:MFS transporter [Rhodospirillales bacterium]MAX46709.1 MFS transporter [Rhodospirillaceae bacterium]